jgi:hypothetical protein
MKVNPASFLGGDKGKWQVLCMHTLCGTSLPAVTNVDVHCYHVPIEKTPATWILRGTNVHVRYTERPEITELNTRQPILNRPEATHAALIPIRKSEHWWQLSQEERREIFERQSHHIAMSMAYLPAIARRLYQSRELCEPFDFLTWFEFAPEHEALFDELLGKLRTSREWEFVEREVDIRLKRVV